MNKPFTGWVMGVSVFAALLGGDANAQANARVAHTSSNVRATHVGVPQDWSQQHLIYANPATPEEAAARGRLEQWRRDASDPRFMLALAQRLRAEAEREGLRPAGKGKPLPASSSQRDWSHALGGSAGVGTPGVYPAKYSFSILAPPNCADDFVVYVTGSDGATSSGVAQTRLATFAANPGAAGTVTLGDFGRRVVLSSSAIDNTGKNFQVANGDPNGNAANLAAAVNRWSRSTGISASAAANVVTLSNNTTGGLAVQVSKSALGGLSFSAGTAGSGTAGQATIVAFNQLYRGTCGATDPYYPSLYWAYNTGDGAVTQTSPTLSYFDNGRQVAFVQTVGANAELVLLKWSNTVSVGTIGAPTAPTSVTPANYRACVAPCMTVLPFIGGDNDSYSSPFVDYFSDELWVGDNQGVLHRFTGVFAGTPAEANGGGFPATVSNGNALSSPVVDFSNNSVLVGSASGAGPASGGRLHRIAKADGTVTSSGKLTVNGGAGVRATPVLDLRAQMAYVFVQEDGVNDPACSNDHCRAVIQMPVLFSAGSTGAAKARVGRSLGSGRIMFAGGFDRAFRTGPTPNGNLYVCGSDPALNGTFSLWKIPIAAGVMQTPQQGPTLTTAGSGDDCSPVSVIGNGPDEFLYASVPDQAIAGGGCLNVNTSYGGCLYLFNLTGLTWDTSALPTAKLQAVGGGSGIVMDNTSSLTGASQIYFSTLRSPGNAVQASQAGLQ